MEFDGDFVTHFREKPDGDGGQDQRRLLRRRPLGAGPRRGDPRRSGSASRWRQLATSGELAAYHHDGFWQPMDTLRDKIVLDEMWAAGKAPWKQW